MPTAITHGLVGGALGRIAPEGLPRWKLPVLFAMMAILPDLDVIAFKLGIPYGHPMGHRGFSHSLGFALIQSLLVCTLFIKEIPRFSMKWTWVFCIAFLAAASHGLLDAATDAGLGVGFFLPFSEERFFYEFRPIQTTVVNPLKFFYKGSLNVLKSEIIWIWSPLTAFSLLFGVIKYVLKPQKIDHTA